MNYLLVVDHPDDEVLGAGGTISIFVSQGHKVAVAIMSGHAAARKNLSDTLAEDEVNAMKILGVEKVYHADFPNIQMNTVPHLDLVKFIEGCIVDWNAEAIFTHHPSDVNIDHQETSKAAIAACRLFQRTDNVPKLRLFAYMEVLSSTEWSLNTADNRFMPNYFVEVGKDGLNTKLKALRAYNGVMRQFPHPRSDEALEGLAAYRGCQSGLEYAEAFETVFMTV